MWPLAQLAPPAGQEKIETGMSSPSGVKRGREILLPFLTMDAQERGWTVDGPGVSLFVRLLARRGVGIAARGYHPRGSLMDWSLDLRLAISDSTEVVEVMPPGKQGLEKVFVASK